SAPVQNPLPAPVSTSARMSGLVRASVSTARSSSRISSLMALRASGRFKGIQATWFSIRSSVAWKSGISCSPCRPDVRLVWCGSCSSARGSARRALRQFQGAAGVVTQEELPDFGGQLEGIELGQDPVERQQRVVGGEADLALPEGLHEVD